MSGQVQLIAFGGTLLMKKDPVHGLVPTFDLNEIIPGGAQAYGYASKPVSLDYAPIDSINFDVNAHYYSLRKAVLEAIRKGDVPVIAGGTDTLRFYGTLLAEDLAQLHKTGQVKALPPVILVSSMYAFGEKPEHVQRLLKAARVAADEAVIHNKAGVYAMQPDDEAVKKVGLMDMQQPSDKISGKLVKAFVGTEAFRISPETKAPGEVYPNHDPRRIEGENIKNPSKFFHRLVAPPLEAGNGAAAIQHFLHAINDKPNDYPFKAVIIKGALADGRKVPEPLLHEIAALQQKKIDVFFVNDPRANKSGKLISDDKFTTAPARRTLESAGAIFLDGMTSTQAFIRASLTDFSGAPVYFTEARAKATQTAASYLAEHPAVTETPTASLPSALALEYVPVHESYATALKLASRIGIKTLVSINCTDGALAESHAETFKQHPNLKVVCTFKYAGTRYPDHVESATLSAYAPAVHLMQQGLVTPGGEEPPEKLLSKALGEGRS